MEENSKFLKKFLIALGVGFVSIFLASFLAFYLVFHQLTNNMQVSYFNSSSNNPFVISQNIDRDFDNLIRDTQRFTFYPRFVHAISPAFASIRTEDNRDSYKILLNLKSFGNNEKNVAVKASGNRLTVIAKYENKDKDRFFNSSNFYQSVLLPKKIDPSKIKKEKKGDMLIISVPKK